MTYKSEVWLSDDWFFIFKRKMSVILSPHNMTDILRKSNFNHEKKRWFTFTILAKIGITFLNRFKTRQNLNINFWIKCPPFLKRRKWRTFSNWCVDIVVETKKVYRKRSLLSVTYKSEVWLSDDWFSIFKNKMSVILSPPQNEEHFAQIEFKSRVETLIYFYNPCADWNYIL